MPSRFDARVLLVAAGGTESFTYPQLHRRALERLGCRVGMVDHEYGPGWSRLLGMATLGPRLRRALAKHEPDIVLVLNELPLDEPTLSALRRVSPARWALWATGDFPPTRCEALRAAARLYDAVFITSTMFVRSCASAVTPPVTYLADGCDPSVHRPMRSRDQFRANVVFAGRATPHRERFLSGLVGFGLALWGPGWRRTALRDYCRGERLSLADYVRAYAGAFVGVNVHQEEPSLTGEGCNRRLFELAAVGVPQVAADCADLRRHFTPGAEVVCHRDERELKELVGWMLDNPAESDAMADAARRRALAEHTLMHRMLVLLTEVQTASPSRRPPRPAHAAYR